MEHHSVTMELVDLGKHELMLTHITHIKLRKVTMAGRFSMQHFTQFQHFQLSKIYFELELPDIIPFVKLECHHGWMTLRATLFTLILPYLALRNTTSHICPTLSLALGHSASENFMFTGWYNCPLPMTQHKPGSPGTPAAPAELTHRQSAPLSLSSWSRSQ